jgi:hypothetical protein
MTDEFIGKWTYREFGFNSDAARYIIRETGGPMMNADPNALAADLQNTADIMFVTRGLQGEPTVRQKEKTLTNLRTALSRAVNTLGIAEEADIRDACPWLFTELYRAAETHAAANGGHPGIQPTWFDSEAGSRLEYGSAEAVLTAVDRVKRLFEWVELVATEDNRVTTKNCKILPKAESAFIGQALPEVYARHAGRPFRISRSPEDGHVYGPALRFVQAVLHVIGLRRTDETIVQTWRRHRPQ